MRLPNRFGSVTKLSGTRRNPFWVRKTIGWNDKGHPIYQTIGYVKTREEGFIMLSEFNNEPWDIDANKLTFKELYERWEKKRLPNLKESNQSAMRAAFKYCFTLHHLIFKKITIGQLRDVIINCDKSYAIKNSIKSFMDKMYKFAIEEQIRVPNYAELIESTPATPKEKKPISDEDIGKLWEHKDNQTVQTILILLYTGFRISELCDIRLSDIDLKLGFIKGGAKTKSGKNRMVPIHSSIASIVADRCANNINFLVENKSGEQMKAYNFTINYFKPTLKSIEITEEYTPHFTRHTLRTKMDNAGVNKRVMDLIMGHSSRDVGDRVYNHKTLEQLKKEIELVTS